MPTIKYPSARRDDVVDDYHGRTVADPYRWLEGQGTAAVKKFVKEQNRVTDELLRAPRERERIKENLMDLMSFSEYECPFRRGDRYFYFVDDVLHMFQSLDDEEEGEVVLDVTSEVVLSGMNNVSLSTSLYEKTGENFGNYLCSISNNGEYLAYGVTENGSVWNTIHFKNLTTGEYYPDRLEDVQDTYLSWTVDNKGLFYGRHPDKNSYENEKIYYHVLGTNQSKDRMVVEFPDNPKWELKSKVSDCGEYLLTYVLQDCGGLTKVYLSFIADLLGLSKVPDNAKENGGASKLFPLVSEFEGDYDYITNSGSKFYFLTNKDAPNSMVVSIDLSSPISTSIPNLKINHVLKEHRKDVLEWAICVFRRSTWGLFDESKYKINQVFYKSKDKTRVPMFIVRKKKKRAGGISACLLRGNGGFNASMKPIFHPAYIAFLQHFDGIFAVANIRGGGEYGKHWYEDGIHLKKQNSFDDFQAAAEYLIRKKFTSARKLVIRGESNGGLLVAACVNQKPHLFGAAVAGYGVMDMLRFHKFTTGSCWISDYGCSDDKTDFENLISYSPLHNVRVPQGKGIQYPAVLMITADHDERVMPLHSYKMIAELQHSLGSHPKQENPLLIRILTNSGHGDGMSFDSSVDEVADILTFIMLALGLQFKE